MNNNIKIVELCGECGKETQINENGGNCEHCGRFTLPCSLCDCDIVNCNECRFTKKEGN